MKHIGINAKVASHVFSLLASVEGTTDCLEIPLQSPPPPGDRHLATVSPPPHPGDRRALTREFARGAGGSLPSCTVLWGGGVTCPKSLRCQRRPRKNLPPEWSCGGKVRFGSSRMPPAPSHLVTGPPGGWGDRRAFWGDCPRGRRGGCCFRNFWNHRIWRFLFVVVHDDQVFACDLGLWMAFWRCRLLSCQPTCPASFLSFGGGDWGIT